MSNKEAVARIKVNKLLELAGWRFFPEGNSPANIQLEPSVKIKTSDLQALGENFEKASKGFIDFLLLDGKGFPLIVLEAKAEDKNPLVGKEQARKYAKSYNCRFVILSNGNLHYFWDLERGNPYLITSFPTPDSVIGYQQVTPNPQRLIEDQIGDDYIVLTQRPNYQSEAAWRNEAERPGYIQANKLRFLRPYQLKAIHSLQRAVKDGKDRFLFEMATGTGKTLTAAAVIKLFLRSGNARRVLFLVDRLELEDQAKKAFAALLSADFRTVIYKENRDDWRRAEIVVTTVQSLLFNNKYQRLFSPTDFDLVISDEAHRSIGGNAQVVITGVSFLQFVPSPGGNGMGGISSSPNTNDPFALITNPAQLGMQSLSQNFGAGFFTPRTTWLPFVPNSGITYTADVAFVGIRIDRYLDVPFPLSVGLAYSYTKFDMADFYRLYVYPMTGFMAHPEDHANGYTLGVGLDFGIKLGLGVTKREVRSGLLTFSFPGGFSVVTGGLTAYDYSVLASVPVVRLIPGATTLVPEIEPVLDVNLSAGRDNVGNGLSYIDVNQTDPLPRIAFAALSVQAGAVTHHFGFDWNLVGLTIARQGEGFLPRENVDGSWYYAGGFGDLNFVRNVIGGKRSEMGGVRKGVEVNLAEVFSYRKGSLDLYAYGRVSTSGYGLRLRGILNAIEAVGVRFPEDGIAGYLLRHVDISYDHSKYSSTTSGLDQTTFSGVTVGLR